MVISFGASLFGNRFLFRNHHYITKPSQAYHLRKPYAQKHGPYGENFIETVSFYYTIRRTTTTYLIKNTLHTKVNFS